MESLVCNFYLSVAAHRICLSRSVPEIHLHVGGTISNQQKTTPLVSESEYIFRLHKDIIPLRLQQGYRPDGWLGILVGSRLYFDLSSEDLLRTNLPKLVKELGIRGKINTPATKAADGVDGRWL